MINTKLNLRLKAEYEQKIREYLQQLKKDGYIISSDIEITESRYIVHYDCQRQDFLQVCHISDFFDEVIVRNVTNPFNINLTYSEILSLIVETLPFAISFDLEDFRQYEKYELDYIGNDELSNELNDFIKLSKSLTKQIDLTNFTNPNSQAQILNKELIFYTGDSHIGNISEQKSYYRYDKKQKLFIKVNATDIQEILVKKFDIHKNSLDIRDVKRNMRSIYTELVNSSTLPIRWNHNAKAKEKMNEVSKGYKKVKKITDCFEM